MLYSVYRLKVQQRLKQKNMHCFKQHPRQPQKSHEQDILQITTSSDEMIDLCILWDALP